MKNEPILDLAAVSAGFVLRAIAGGVATGVALSNWFLIVASFGSLLIVTGKRSGEKQLLGARTPTTAPSVPDARLLHRVSCGRSGPFGGGDGHPPTACGRSSGPARCTPATTRSGSS